ncbi:unnamed protein product [Polarella glacialis]|uniref:Uncharacterized protein n=1 Tax=Polarella glacialis TaxID=89957 RepID=A0A813HN24_POLGL|nr:unnamed protein product [Polarella glacialis]
MARKGRRKFSKVLFWCHGTAMSHHQGLQEIANWAGAKLIYRPRSSMFVDWLQSNLGCFDSCTLIIDPEEVPALIEVCMQHGLHRSPGYPEQVIIFSTMPASPSSGASFLSEVQVRQQRTKKQEDTVDKWKLLRMASSQTQMERLLSEAAPAFYED